MSKSSENLFADVIGKAAPKGEETPVVDAASVSEETADAVASEVSELEMLKNRARLMGITFSNNISAETLKARIQAKLDGEAEQSKPEQTENQENKEPEVTQTAPSAKAAKPKTLRQQLYEREMKLVRLRITNLDPKKKDLPGEIITVANSVLGTVRKFVPFGEVTDDGYHVPHCIYKQLRDREFLHIRTRKGSHGGTPIVESKMVREFALEILPPLTKEELAKLAAAQAAKAGD